MRHLARPRIVATLLLGAFSAPLFTLAQGAGTVAPFTLEVSTLYPAPYTVVTITPLSTLLDLSNATLVVTVNGKETYRGNAKPFEVTMGEPGATVTVRATLLTYGGTYAQTLSLRPQDVSLIAEPIATAPALYPGKPLIPLEGSTRIVAVANVKTAAGKALEPLKLSYSWKVDGAQIAAYSGIGKSAVVVESPMKYRAREVSVTVQSQDGALVGGASMTISASVPSVRIYKNDPLLGILFDHALLNTYTTGADELSLYAAPFSFSSAKGVPSLRWTLNGSPVQEGSLITLRPEGKGRGNAVLSLIAGGETFSPARADLKIDFGTASNGNFFGL